MISSPPFHRSVIVIIDTNDDMDRPRDDIVLDKFVGRDLRKIVTLSILFMVCASDPTPLVAHTFQLASKVSSACCRAH